MDYSNVKLGMIDRFKVFLKRREAEKTEDERLKYETNDDYNPDYSEAKQLEQELLSRKIAKLKAKEERRIAKQNKKEGVKLLAEAVYKEPVNQMEQYKMDATPKYAPPIGTLDHALEQYLLGIVGMVQKQGFYDSYKVLINLGIIPNQENGNNLQNEKNLIKILENRQMQAKQRNQPRDFCMQRQPEDPSKETVFFHVQKNYNFYPEKRIYLNCKKENIAGLAYTLMNHFEDLDSYYLKFSSDKHAREIDRSEQIVIYLKDDEQLMNIATRIEKAKMESPQLFEGSENVNPFLKNYGGYIAYANQPPSHKIKIQDEQNQAIKKLPKKQIVYNDMKGGNKLLPASYNSMLAVALEEAFVNGVNTMLDKDSSFSKTVKEMIPRGQLLNDASVYAIAILPEILKDDQNLIKLMTNMKAGLKVLSEKNPSLEIKGIDDEKQQENNVNYFK